MSEKRLDFTGFLGSAKGFLDSAKGWLDGSRNDGSGDDLGLYGRARSARTTTSTRLESLSSSPD
jgi:hypothetical protein